MRKQHSKTASVTAVEVPTDVEAVVAPEVAIAVAVEVDVVDVITLTAREVPATLVAGRAVVLFPTKTNSPAFEQEALPSA